MSQRFDLKSSNKHAALQNTRKQCKKKKQLKIIAHIRNDQFELPDGFYSVSDMQKYIEYTTKKKKNETLTKFLPIHVYINRINNISVFEIKGSYKLGLQTPETMKLFDSSNKLIDKTKNGEKVLSLEVVEVVLV